MTRQNQPTRRAASRCPPRNLRRRPATGRCATRPASVLPLPWRSPANGRQASPRVCTLFIYDSLLETLFNDNHSSRGACAGMDVKTVTRYVHLLEHAIVPAGEPLGVSRPK